MSAVLAYLPEPPIHNITIGPLTFHVYGLILGIAVVAAVLVAERTTMRHAGAPEGTITAIALPAVVVGFIGGRIYHVLSQPDYYWHHPVSALEIWHGGLGVWGGIPAGVAVGAWGLRRRHLKVMPILDATVPALAIAQGIGRWGNYVNQELFGRPTHLPWALHVSADAVQTAFGSSATLLAKYGADRFFHPTFLYESLWDLALGVVLLVLVTRWRTRKTGMLTSIYVAGYCLGRLGVEHLRIDEAHHFLGLRQNEWVALALTVIGLVSCLWIQLRKRA